MNDIFTVVSADVLALAYDPDSSVLRLGLHRRDLPPFDGELALPGVVVRSGERLQSAARRALSKVTDLEPLFIGQLRTFDEPSRDPRGPSLSIALAAVLPAEASADGEWFDLAGELPALAFDHTDIVSTCLPMLGERLWRDQELTRAILPDEFTTADAVTVTAALTGQDPHRPNLNRTLDALPGITRKGTRSAGAGRPVTVRSFTR